MFANRLRFRWHPALQWCFPEVGRQHSARRHPDGDHDASWPVGAYGAQAAVLHIPHNSCQSTFHDGHTRACKGRLFVTIVVAVAAEPACAGRPCAVAITIPTTSATAATGCAVTTASDTATAVITTTPTTSIATIPILLPLLPPTTIRVRVSCPGPAHGSQGRDWRLCLLHSLPFHHLCFAPT